MSELLPCHKAQEMYPGRAHYDFHAGQSQTGFQSDGFRVIVAERVIAECEDSEVADFITAAWNARPAPALTPKQKAADEMFTKLDKIAKWLESLAALSEKQIETCRFESLNDAYRANAKNYKATARDIRSTLAKAGQP